MPCDYEIDLQRRLLKCRVWGAATHAEISQMRQKFTHDPAFRSDLFQLYDLRDATGLTISAGEIRDLAGYSPFSREAKRAIVAQRDAVYGAARMFALLREAGGAQEQIQVFRSLSEANAWLGLENKEIRSG